ncbi:hypothetical protein ABE426_03735 [Sphingobacterium faecium]|uniref:hypothetical protein n=1 Tax=Sphingobacterium faecium TaxID=34087 RepID=UPI00320951AF
MKTAISTDLISENRFHRIFLKRKKLRLYSNAIYKTPNYCRWLLVLICAVFFLTARGQHVATPNSYEGIWAGVLKNSKDSKLAVIVRISNGTATRYNYNVDNKKIEKYDFLKEMTMIVGNNLSYTWMNKGGVWSETQTHMMSYAAPDMLKCRLIRQVTNTEESKEDPGMNDEWSTYFQGFLDRFESIQELEKFMNSDD